MNLFHLHIVIYHYLEFAPTDRFCIVGGNSDSRLLIIPNLEFAPTDRFCIVGGNSDSRLLIIPTRTNNQNTIAFLSLPIWWQVFRVPQQADPLCL